MNEEGEGGKPLQLIPGAKQVDAMADALRNMKRNMEMYIEYHQLNAKLQRAKYLVLIEVGFSKEEALQLCK